MALFSVVISVYNKEAYIEDTVRSVLNQSFTDFEVIIVNDGSTDNSLNVINNINDDRITVFNKHHQGASLCRNTGIKEASSQYIALLDGDDLWDKDYLKYIYESILEFPDYSVYTTAVAYKYSNKIVSARYNFSANELISIHNFFKSSLEHTILTSSSIVIKKQVLEVSGYFDPKIKTGQDTDLWIRIGIHYDVVFINKILAYYRFVPESLSNTNFNIKEKPKYDNYLNDEQKNKPLKIYIDRNRFPLAIISKLHSDSESFNYYNNSLDSKNLPLRQRFLLKSPKWLIKILLKIKSLKGEKLYYPND